MKKIFFTGFILTAILIFGGMSPKDKNVISVENKDTKLPGWQWTSGEVPMKKTAAKECFTISFSPKVYRPRDSIKIIFSSYKVSLTGLNKQTTFDKWTGKTILVYYINANWIPEVVDTNDRINLPFSGQNNVASDSLVNYSILTTVPLSRTLTLTSSAISFYMHMASGNGHPISVNGAPTLTTSISGIEIKKLP